MDGVPKIHKGRPLKPTTEVIDYKGIRYYRNPDAKSPARRDYFVSNYASGNKRLHVTMWEEVHGPVPKGHHIHHKDGISTHNWLDNFECLTRSEHLSLHARKRIGDPKWMKLWREIGIKRLPDFMAWHRSDAGAEHHKQLGLYNKSLWPDKVKVPCICALCGSKFESYFPTRAKFCSEKCHYTTSNAKAKERREQRLVTPSHSSA